MKDNVNNELCSYGCGSIGKYWFPTAEKWCCSPSFNTCPQYKIKTRPARIKAQINKKSRIHGLRIQIENKELECFFCGSLATHIVSEYRPCCSAKASGCPDHKEWRSNRHKQKYIDDPGLRDKMSKKMKEVQNRPEVKEKKSKAMKVLYSDDNDCIPCVEFQENYNKGRAIFMEGIYRRHYMYLHDIGYEDCDIPDGMDERRVLVGKLKLEAREKGYRLMRLKNKEDDNA